MNPFSSIHLADWRKFTCTGCQEVCRAAPGADISASLCSTCQSPERFVEPDPSEEARIPNLYRSGWTLEDWIAEFGKPPRKLGRWIEEPQSVLAYGNTGTGKTGLLTLLMQEYLHRHSCTGLWIRGQALLEGLKGGIGLSGQGSSVAEKAARKLVERAQRCQVLLVDDLFAGAVKVGASRQLEVSPWVKERLLAIFCHRFDHQAITLTTSMLTPKQLGEIDMSLASRLVQTIVVPLKGEDRRLG
ncbi:MAG: hypothetical protein K0U98_06130 [Deltaproteobacteria bacterium]|nr:hypothetical protein [Deltaproteobacteria bacterium]